MKNLMKKWAKAIGKQLLKVNWFRREVEAWRKEHEDQREEQYRHDWQLIMKGQAVRDAETEKPSGFDRFDCCNWGVGE